MDLQLVGRGNTLAGYGHPYFYFVDRDATGTPEYRADVQVQSDTTPPSTLVTVGERGAEEAYNEQVTGLFRGDATRQLALDAVGRYITQAGEPTAA
jgi:hypothetical protein